MNVASAATALCTALGAALAAALYLPRVASVFPAGAQRGTDCEVTLRGERLDSPQLLLGDLDGIEVSGLASSKPDRCTVHLRLAADCALGARVLRLCTAEGISNAFEFRVGPLPEVLAADTEAPQPLPLDRTVEGELGAGLVHRFAVEIAADVRVRCEIEAMRLGQRATDLALEVRGPDGAIVAAGDDSAAGGKDPVLAFVAATAGVYTIAVRGAFPGDSDRGVYRLHVGTFPRPLAALPCGGAPGESLQLQLLGDGEPGTATATLPASDAQAHPFFAQQGDRIAPTPIWLRVGGPPNRAPTTDDKGRAIVQFPASIDGVLAAPGAAAKFCFHAEKGEELLFRAFARTLCSPLDPLLILREAGGRYLASNDDQQGLGLDSQLRFKADNAGDYELEVRDLLRAGSPAHVFRLEGDRPAPEPMRMRMVLGRREDPVIVVPRGGAMGAVLQLQNFDPKQGLSLLARDLPNGVYASFGQVIAGTNLVPLLLEADQQAPLGAARTGFVLRAAQAPAERDPGYAQDLPLVTVRNDAPIVTAPQTALPIAVIAPAPFAVELLPPTVPILRGAPLPLRVRVRRDADNKERLRIRALWTPPGLSAGQCVIDGNKTDGELSLSASDGAQLGTFPFAVIATAYRGGIRVETASTFVQLTVEGPWLTAKAEPLRTDTGASLQVKFDLTISHALAGPWQARLLSLPRGVTADALELPADAKAAVFTLRVADDAQPGRHKDWVFDARLPSDGGTVTCRQPGSELRIDAGAKANGAGSQR